MNHRAFTLAIAASCLLSTLTAQSGPTVFWKAVPKLPRLFNPQSVSTGFDNGDTAVRARFVGSPTKVEAYAYTYDVDLGDDADALAKGEAGYSWVFTAYQDEQLEEPHTSPIDFEAFIRLTSSAHVDLTNPFTKGDVVGTAAAWCSLGDTGIEIEHKGGATSADSTYTVGNLSGTVNYSSLTLTFDIPITITSSVTGLRDFSEPAQEAIYAGHALSVEIGWVGVVRAHSYSNGVFAFPFWDVAEGWARSKIEFLGGPVGTDGELPGKEKTAEKNI